MSKEELLKELEDRGFDFDTRALIVDDVLDIINKQHTELKARNKELLQMNEMFLNPKPLIDKLQQQLKEKDEEIEDILKKLALESAENSKLRLDITALNTQLKSNTKQVCEKIRKLWKEQAVYYHICDSGEKLNNKTYQCTILGMNEILFDDMIKKIEKGE